MSHSNCTSALLAGARALPDGVQAFSHTQAMWRFLSNPRVSSKEVAQPLREAARDAVEQEDSEWVLCAHDGSRLNYGNHEAKRDRLQMTHEHDVGYELQSSLLVGADDGAPLAVAVQNLVTAEGVWRCRETGIVPDEQTHLDELSERMDWLENSRGASVWCISSTAKPIGRPTCANGANAASTGWCVSRRLRRCAPTGSR